MTPKTKSWYERNPEERCKDQSLLSRPMRDCIEKLGKLFGFVIVETWRAGSRQDLMFDTKKSKTRKSNHETGDAADTMPIGGYDKPMDWSAMHAAWDKIVTAHHDPDWVVMPEKMISWDSGHFGMTRKPRK